MDLEDFIRESNRIEGILRDPTALEIDAFENFIDLSIITVSQLKTLVSVFQPNAQLRNKSGLNVRIGNHYPPEGGKEIETRLSELLLNAKQEDPESAYRTHLIYETLHPFTDGNGRSGRALWAWQMQYFPLGFLHSFYYQTLSYK